MARTFRRKNFEATLTSSWDANGFKTAGHYTTYDGSWVSWSCRGPVIFRPMDKREKYRQWRWFHGESKHANQRSPGFWYRDRRQRQNRMINKTELVKWIKAGGEYEPFFESDPRSAKWDWR